MSRLKAIALNPTEQKQFFDHLAPLAVGLGVPLLLHNEEEAEALPAFYPGLSVAFLPFAEFSPEWLISQYDMSILSDQWPRDEFNQKFALLEMKYGKKFRNIHCPHGFSDKGFYLRGAAWEDICLIYGQNMLDLLQEWGVKSLLQDHLLVGNFRYNYYRQHAAFFQELVREQILERFVREQPILLYAPTCEDKENSSSYYGVVEKLLQQLPNEYNLIIKPHPQLLEADPARFWSLVGKHEKKPNVLFLIEFHSIYPLLAISDFYLGDLSSIGYDFLAFNRPMFFLNHQRRYYPPDRGVFLFQCGTVIEPEEFGQIFQKIEQGILEDQQNYTNIREQIYQYTFGSELSFGEIKKQLWEITNKRKLS